MSKHPNIKGKKCLPPLCPNGGPKGENLFKNGDLQSDWNGWILPAGKGTVVSSEFYNSNWPKSSNVGVLNFDNNKNFAQSFNLKDQVYNLRFQYARRQGNPAKNSMVVKWKGP